MRPQEGLQSPPIQGLERDLGDVLDLCNNLAGYPEVGLQTGLHGEQLPQRGDARDDLHGVEHDYAAPQEVDEAYDKVVYFRGRDVGHQDFLKVTCKPQYGHHARLGEVVEGALVVQAARDPQAAHDEAGLGEHAEDVGGAALELPRFGDAREGGGGLDEGGVLVRVWCGNGWFQNTSYLIRHPLYLPLNTSARRVGKNKGVQPVRDVVALDPGLGHQHEDVGGLCGHGSVRVPLLEVAVPDPAPRDLARLVVVARKHHALAAVPALVEPPARPAPRLVHVEHLPVAQRAPVALLGEAERRAHAVPQPVGLVRHGGMGGPLVCVKAKNGFF